MNKNNNKTLYFPNSNIEVLLKTSIKIRDEIYFIKNNVEKKKNRQKQKKKWIFFDWFIQISAE